jgi:hypothetical protein
MFLRNKTALDVRLARGHVTDHVAVASVVVSASFRFGAAGLAPCHETIPPSESDPPPEVSRFALWTGVSVTAAGSAAGPATPPHVCPVFFRIGSAERRLIVFGDRRWERVLGGGLQPSAPAPFERLSLSFARAFGGTFDVPPGLVPGTDLPHPGVRVAYPLNEGGVGYYPDERAAQGAPLPNIERPDQLVRRWNDAPEPAGFTPCRELVYWRMREEGAALAARSEADPDAIWRGAPPPLRLQHHAPPSLIFDELSSGTAIELHGISADPIRFLVPPLGSEVTVRVRRARVVVRPKLRALHVDAERSVLRAIHDHTFRYDPGSPPEWIVVTPSSKGAS